jgi:hypothetical protein
MLPVNNHVRAAITRWASPRSQWPSRLNPTTTTDRTMSGLLPAALASAATTPTGSQSSSFGPRSVYREVWKRGPQGKEPHRLGLESRNHHQRLGTSKLRN